MDSTRRHRTVSVAACVLVTVCAIVLASCTSGSGDSDSGNRSTDDITSPGTITQHESAVDGVDRTWTTYTPAHEQPSDEPMPVVLVIHGSGDTGDGIRGGIGEDLEKRAEQDGFVIAYVDGYKKNWNECRIHGDWPAKEKNVDDVGLMREVVDQLGNELGPDTVDADRVFAIGYSSGGHLVQRLALEAPDLVSGIAAVSANVPAKDNRSCDDAREPVPALFLEGEEDEINPIDGGEVNVGKGSSDSRGSVLSAVNSAEWFAERNGAGPATTSLRDGDAETRDWPGEYPVRLTTVDKSEHSFPTASGRWGNNNGARYDGPGAIWDFFAAIGV